MKPGGEFGEQHYQTTSTERTSENKQLIVIRIVVPDDQMIQFTDGAMALNEGTPSN